MPICIAGMHRSGTSMVARALSLCNIFMGAESDFAPPQVDNPEGYCENLRFVRLNDEILAAYGGGWDVPPVFSNDWEIQPKITPLRAKAAMLIQQFAQYESWGWKDPRNSLSFPFWKRLIPNLQIVNCIRNPLEVVQSLQTRGYSSENFGFNLWLTYNQHLMAAVRQGACLITHYEAYFVDPCAEMTRVLGLLGLEVSEGVIRQASEAATVSLRHNRRTTQDLLEADVPTEVVDLYLELCAGAGPVFQLAQVREPATASPRYNLVEPTRRDQLDGFRVSQIQALSLQLGANERALLEVNNRLTQNEDSLQTMRAKLGQMEQAHQTIQLQLAEKDGSIQVLHMQLSKKESLVHSMNVQLSEKESLAHSMNVQLTEKESLVHSMSVQLTEKDQSIRAIQQTVVEQGEHLDALTARIGFLARRESELRTLLLDAHEQLRQRDAEIQKPIVADYLSNPSSAEEVSWLRDQIGKMQATRVWQMGTLYWNVHALFTKWLRH